MKTFLVELYLARAARGELQRQAQGAQAAAERLTARGTRISYLRTHFAPEDESCFHVFTGTSRDDVAEACRRAGIAFERIVEAVGPGADQGGERCLPRTN